MRGNCALVWRINLLTGQVYGKKNEENKGLQGEEGFSVRLPIRKGNQIEIIEILIGIVQFVIIVQNTLLLCDRHFAKDSLC